MNIVVVNQCYSDNIGDKLIGEILFDYLKNQKYHVNLAGYAQTSQQDIIYNNRNKVWTNLKKISKRICPEIIKFILIYRKKINNEIKKSNLKEADALLLGGGQLLKHKSVFTYCFYYWTKKAVEYNVPIYIHGIGVDTNLNMIEKRLYHSGLKKVKYINCRDKVSAKYLKIICGRNISVSPDIAFTYHKLKETKKIKNNLIIMPYNYYIAKTNFIFFRNKKTYYDFLLNVIRNSKSNGELLLASTTSSDLEECYTFQTFLERRNIRSRVCVVKNADELIELYSQAMVVCSGRMHAMILALVSDCKIISIPVSNKIRSFEKEYINYDKIDDIFLEAIQGLKKTVEIMNDENKNTT